MTCWRSAHVLALLKPALSCAQLSFVSFEHHFSSFSFPATGSWIIHSIRRLSVVIASYSITRSDRRKRTVKNISPKRTTLSYCDGDREQRHRPRGIFIPRGGKRTTFISRSTTLQTRHILLPHRVASYIESFSILACITYSLRYTYHSLLSLK